MSDNPVLVSASVKVSAADIYVQARLKDYEAALLHGSRDELERARLGALAGFEALLDAKQDATWLMLRSVGIDPRDRP